MRARAHEQSFFSSTYFELSCYSKSSGAQAREPIKIDMPWNFQSVFFYSLELTYLHFT